MKHETSTSTKCNILSQHLIYYVTIILACLNLHVLVHPNSNVAHGFSFALQATTTSSTTSGYSTESKTFTSSFEQTLSSYDVVIDTSYISSPLNGDGGTVTVTDTTIDEDGVDSETETNSEYFTNQHNHGHGHNNGNKISNYEEDIPTEINLNPIPTSETDLSVPVLIQGGSIRTFSLDEKVPRILVHLKSHADDRPLGATLELWEGPDNIPETVDIYLEDGGMRPFRAIIETPGNSNSIAIRNTASTEFPLTAEIEVDAREQHQYNHNHNYHYSQDPTTSSTNKSTSTSFVGPAQTLLHSSTSEPRIIQGGAAYTFSTPLLPSSASSVQLMLMTDTDRHQDQDQDQVQGGPLNARVELLQGPNNTRQVMDIFAQDGMQRPFYCIIDTPGSGNAIRVVNKEQLEFPLTVVAEPYAFEEETAELDWHN